MYSRGAIDCLDLESWSTTALIASAEYGPVLIDSGVRLPASAEQIQARVDDIWPLHYADHITDCRDTLLDSCLYLARSNTQPGFFWFVSNGVSLDMFCLVADIEPEDGIPAPAGMFAMPIRRAPGWGLFRWVSRQSATHRPPVIDQLDAYDLSSLESHSSMWASSDDTSSSSAASLSSPPHDPATSSSMALLQTKAELFRRIPTPCRS